MERHVNGLHHVTAIAGDPQTNIDFYAGVLGLRLVKKTVNYDDPGSYHFYYGNGMGEPGTILTFFPWPGAARGRLGAGQTTSTALSVPEGSLDYWANRLSKYDTISTRSDRFGRAVLSFADTDGLALDLIESTADMREPWTEGGVDGEHAIRGLHSVTLTQSSAAGTESMLRFLGYERGETVDDRTRYALPTGQAALIDIVEDRGARAGRIAAGTVHHIAFRTPDDASQELWLASLRKDNVGVSPVQDRQYFHSIYFREPGGVLFEIATDPPGFLTDETVSTLGTDLRLPEWFEQYRDRIEAALPKVTAPSTVGV